MFEMLNVNVIQSFWMLCCFEMVLLIHIQDVKMLKPFSSLNVLLF
jgi:hypothetical protein